MTNETILAIDLGKFKSVACAYPRGGGSPAFDTIPSSHGTLLALLDHARPAGVVIEACASAGWVHDLCAELPLPCRVANTASAAWQFKHARRKTDKDDALRLARLQALGQLPTVVIPPVQTRQWRALIAARQGLVGRRCAAQNRGRALLVGQGLPAPRGAKAWTEQGLEGIGRHAKPLADCAADELWRGLLGLALAEYRQARELIGQAEAKLDALAKADAGVRLPETIPGVSPRTVQRWLNAYLDRGLPGLPPRTARGAAAKIPAFLADEIRRWVIAGPAKQVLDRANWTHAALADHLRKVTGIQASRAAMGRFCRQVGIRVYRPSYRHRPGNPEPQAQARAEPAELKTGPRPASWSR